MSKEKVKKPFYKRLWFLVPTLFIGIILLSNLIGGVDEDLEEEPEANISNDSKSKTTAVTESDTDLDNEEESSLSDDLTTEVSADEKTEDITEEKEVEVDNSSEVDFIAETYITTMPFSKSGLIDQLEFEGYSTEEATNVVEKLDVDWMEQAKLKAQDYFETMPFSKDGLIEQLVFEGFSEEEANYGATQVEDAENSNSSKTGETMSQANAVKQAESYLKSMPFSKSGLVDQLVFEGYPAEDASYAVDQIEVDWKEQAKLKAIDYLDTMPFSRVELIDQLVFEGFSVEEATYGVDQTDL